MSLGFSGWLISTINAARRQRLTGEFGPFLAIYYFLSQFIDCPTGDSSIAATVLQRRRLKSPPTEVFFQAVTIVDIATSGLDLCQSFISTLLNPYCCHGGGRITKRAFGNSWLHFVGVNDFAGNYVCILKRFLSDFTSLSAKQQMEWLRRLPQYVLSMFSSTVRPA